MERNSEEYGYTVPALHDYEQYGYENEALVGQRQWYKDYMNKNVRTSSGNIGLPEEIYSLKPAKESNFENSYEIDVFNEPDNLIEEIKEIINQLIKRF